jgi:hypothetical protein
MLLRTYDTECSNGPSVPASRSITVPQESAYTSRAVAGRAHVRKTRTVICTLMGGLLQPWSL